MVPVKQANSRASEAILRSCGVHTGSYMKPRTATLTAVLLIYFQKDHIETLNLSEPWENLAWFSVL